MSEKLILSIDGGGTKTSLVLADVSQGKTVIRYQQELGPCNVTSAKLMFVFKFLEKAIEDARSKVPCEQTKFETAVFAFAGMANQEIHDKFENWITSNHFANHWFLFSDIELIHCLGSSMARENNPVIAVIAGTGAIAMGNPMGSDRWVRAGGWGSLIGDDGSGYWIGREALRSIFYSEEGGPETELTSDLLVSANADSARELLHSIYATDDPTRQIAELSKRVNQIAQDGDTIAKNILDQAGIHLAQLVTSIIDQMEPVEDYSLVLAGSIICKIERVTNAMKNQLSLRSTLPSEVIFIEDPSLASIEFAKADLATR